MSQPAKQADQTTTDFDEQAKRDMLAAIPLAKNIPIADVMNIFRICDPQKYDEYHDLKRYDERKLSAEKKKALQEAINDLRIKLAFNRISNRVCNNCVDKRFPKEKLICCEKCRLTFWCSPRCKNENAAEHAKWCMQDIDAVETGPMRVAILKTDKSLEGKKPPPKK